LRVSEDTEHNETFVIDMVGEVNFTVTVHSDYPNAVLNLTTTSGEDIAWVDEGETFRMNGTASTPPPSAGIVDYYWNPGNGSWTLDNNAQQIYDVDSLSANDGFTYKRFDNEVIEKGHSAPQYKVYTLGLKVSDSFLGDSYSNRTAQSSFLVI